MEDSISAVQDSTGIVQEFGKRVYGEKTLLTSPEPARLRTGFKGLSTAEQKAASYFRAFVAFRDGNRRYFYSSDSVISLHDSLYQNRIDRCKKKGILSLLNLIFVKFAGKWENYEIYCTATGRRISKGKRGGVYQMDPEGKISNGDETKGVTFYFDKGNLSDCYVWANS